MTNLYKDLMNYELPLEAGEQGSCRIERKVTTEEDARRELLRAAISSNGRYTPAGTYWSLWINDCLVMSDTPDERRDLFEPIFQAKGHCMVNGLGLGVVAGIILETA